MKVIILAAGMGTRLGSYTENLPKGMLDIYGKSIIQRQIEQFRDYGLKDISIVRGYEYDKIKFDNVKYYNNLRYDETNMVYSLFCAREEFTEDILVVYSDILFNDEILHKIVTDVNEVSVLIDKNWRSYWIERYGTDTFDIESLKMDGDNITSLGDSLVDSRNIDGRFVGIVKFRKNILNYLLDKFDKNVDKMDIYGKSGRMFNKIYMTDLIQQIIDDNTVVKGVNVEGGWIELDTTSDYEQVCSWIENNTLEEKTGLKFQE